MTVHGTMLWRSDDAPHVTLLGSIHLLDGPLPAWALDAHASADLVIFETDYAQMPNRFPEMPGGRTISSLSRGTGKAVAKEARRLGLDAEAIDRLYPFCAEIVLDSAMLPDGVKPQLGVDVVLFGQSPRKEILESIDDQLRALTAPPIEEQMTALRLLLSQRAQHPQRMKAAVTAWRRGELEAVWELLRYPELAQRCPGMMASLFSERHQSWGPCAAQYFEETARTGGELLIVVGCGHMVGAESFLAQLARHGYDFHQV